MSRNSQLASAVSMVIAAAAMGTAGNAWSQEQVGEAQPPEATLEEIVVTGSRIRHDAYSSSQPIDILSPSNAMAQGFGDVSSMLQSSTIAAGSPQITAASSTAFVQNGGRGVSTLSLRGLGPTRTLVLLNGRRAGPAGVSGQVSSFDFNVLPLSVIERVEILKDGASSIYGSDAVAGVVNIITKKGDGGTVDGYYSQPGTSGGEETRFSASWGRTFDRGNVRVTADYFAQSELKQGDRSYFKCGEQYIFDPATGDRADAIDPRTGKPACRDLLWGHVWIYDYQDPGGNVRRGAKAQYDYDGDLGDYIPGFAVDPNNPDYMATPPGWYPVAYDKLTDGIANADHPFQDGSTLIPKVERMTFFVDGEFDLTDSVTAYGEVLLNRRKTNINGYRQFWTYIYNEDYGFVLDENGDCCDMAQIGGSELSAGWTGRQWLSPTPITDHNDAAITVDYQRYVAGLRGDLKSGWNWEVSLQYSSSDGEYVDDLIYDDSISDNYFASGSCVGTVSTIRGAPCVDVPWLDPAFLAGEVSPEVRAFLFGQERGTTTYDQWSVEAFMSGQPFDLPAGPLGMAFGVHYQEDEINDTPGEVTLAENVWGATTAGITAGDDTTKAVFAEFEVPLLAGKPMVEQLTLNVSGRYTDVDSYGSDETYKVGVNWALTPTFRIRASQGTSFRTPALYELYLADQTSFLQQRFIDPCINWGTALAEGEIPQQVADSCAAEGLAPDFTGGSITATIVTGGGLGVLDAETSTNRTVGFVWRPEFADLSLSVDYFDIKVEGEVDQLGANQIVYGCYNSDFYPNDPLCELFDRTGLNNGIDNVQDSFINIATQTNKGWDVAALYRAHLSWGDLSLETQHTFTTEDKRGLFADTVEDLKGLFGHPEWVGNLNATLERGPWTFFWGMNFIGSVSNEREFGGDTTTYRGEEVRVVLKSGTITYHNISVARGFEQWGLTARLGVSNAFGEEPPKVTTLSLGEINTVGYSAFYSQYDWVGRSYFFNVTMDF